jgi:hypothetical protein
LLPGFLENAQANRETDTSAPHYNELLRELLLEGATKMKTLFVERRASSEGEDM